MKSTSRTVLNPTQESPKPNIVIKPEEKLTHYQKYKETIKRCQQRRKEMLKKIQEEEQRTKDLILKEEMKLSLLKEILDETLQKTGTPFGEASGTGTPPV